jgi:hypothetical protein
VEGKRKLLRRKNMSNNTLKYYSIALNSFLSIPYNKDILNNELGIQNYPVPPQKK